MPSTRGRQVVIPLTNKSGGSVAAGDVVVIDTTTNESFTTTTTGRAELSVGVAQETIASNAIGRVLIAGYAALVNVPASVTRAHYVETHTVVKQATGNSTRRSGSFGQFLTTSATPTAWLWGQTDQTVTAGTPDLSGMTVERSVQGVSDLAAVYDATAAATRGVPVGFLHSSRQHTVVSDDCFFASTAQVFGGGVTGVVSGTGAQIGTLASDDNNPGIIEGATGSTTTGRSAMASAGALTAVALGGGKVRCSVVVGISALSDGTNTYTIRIGLGDSASGESVDFVGFRYTHSVNAGEWQGVCRANSVETTLDTNVVATSPGIQAFEFEVNAAGTSVEFFIAGASVGTIVTNIPTGSARAMGLLPAYIQKSAGTTTTAFYLDWYQYILEFTTAR